MNPCIHNAQSFQKKNTSRPELGLCVAPIIIFYFRNPVTGRSRVLIVVSVAIGEK